MIKLHKDFRFVNLLSFRYVLTKKKKKSVLQHKKLSKFTFLNVTDTKNSHFVLVRVAAIF